MKKDPTYIFPYFHLTNFKNVPSFTWKFIHLFGTLEYFVSWFVLLKKNTTNWIRLIRGQPLNFRLSVWRMITKGSLQINTASLFKVHLSYGPLCPLHIFTIFSCLAKMLWSLSRNDNILARNENIERIYKQTK